MPNANVPNAAERGAQWCAIALGFVLPISAALDNMLLIAFIILWFSSGHLSERLKRVTDHPVASMGLVFAALMLLGTTWSSASIEQLRHVLVDALRFVVLGLFAVVFLDSSTRDRAQFAFLLSSTLVLLLSFAIWIGIADGIPGLKGRPDYPVVFKYHITHNVLMAIAALLFALHAMEARNRRARFILGGLAIAAIVNVFFLIPGRTGQLALAGAITYLAIAQLGWRRGGVLAGTALAALVAVAWLVPGSVLHQRSSKALEESAAWELGKAQPEQSSVGMRLEYYSNTLELIGEHPVIGVGSGGFRSAYEAKVRGTQMVVTNHPHNAFLHVAAELGLIGLAMLIVLLLVQWRCASRMSGFSERVAARGLIVIFIVAGLVSSTFGDHTEGLFYAWASGLFFATAHRSKTAAG